jgi:hypothetical protein
LLCQFYMVDGAQQRHPSGFNVRYFAAVFLCIFD